MARRGRTAKQLKVIARGKPLRISARIQSTYVARIMQHVDAMISETRKEIEKLFSQDFAEQHFAETVGMDASVSSQARILINRLKKKYDQLFGKKAMGLSTWMVNSLNKNSYDTSKMSLGEMPHLKDEGKKLTISLKELDRTTLQVLKASAARSADFFKSIPERYLNTVAERVYSSIANGNGMQDLQPFFEKYNTGTKNWVHNTAMDQTRKTYNGLNAGRMKSAGFTRGEWIHSGGSQHPRELHIDFDGKTFDLNEGAPVGDEDGNMVMPGDDPNCRCTFTPVITEDNTPNATEQDSEDDE